MNPIKGDRKETSDYLKNLKSTGRNYNEVLDFLKSSIYANPSLGESFMKKISFDIGDILISCFYNKIECNSSHFTSFTSYDRGNCFMFNFGNSSIRNSSHTGQYHGLKLELFAGFDSKMKRFFI